MSTSKGVNGSRKPFKNTLASGLIFCYVYCLFNLSFWFKNLAADADFLQKIVLYFS